MTINTLDVWITDRCQCKCSFCPVINEQSPRHDIDLNTLRTCLAKIPKVHGALRYVKISGGEPLLHGRFRDILKMMTQTGAEIHLFTNGLLLRKYADVLHRFAKIYVSLHSLHNYREIFGVDQKDVVLNSILSLPNQIRRRIILSVGLHRLSQNHLGEVFSFAARSQVQAVNLFPIRGYEHGYNLAKPIPQQDIEPSFMNSVKEHPHVKKYPCSHVLKRIAGMKTRSVAIKSPCLSSLQSLILTANGSIRLCCGDQPPIGHAEGLPNILHNEIAKRIFYEANHRTGVCKTCLAGIDFCPKCFWKKLLKRVPVAKQLRRPLLRVSPIATQP